MTQAQLPPLAVGGRRTPCSEHSHAPYAALDGKAWEEARPSAFTVSHT